jgi:outer membrane protein insertion porin family
LRARAPRALRLRGGPLACAAALAAVLLAGAAPARSQAPDEAAAGRVKVLVAVLPFRVHSAQPLGYLEKSLAELLAARLEASGRVEVLESVVVREALLGFSAGELTEASLRRLAAELGADWVVAGSLTELAGRFSLDVRVTPVREGEALRTLAASAAGEEELLARTNELADRILEVLAGGADRPVIREVRVVGGEALELDVLSGLRLRAGAVFDPALAEADAEQLRALPGIASVTVETEPRAGGVVVSYRVLPEGLAAPELPAQDAALPSAAAAPPAPAARGGERVASVEVRGNRRIETNAIKARIGTRPGEPFDPAQVARDVREVFALGFFRDVRVESADSPDGRVVVFAVEENPVVRQVTLSGNESLGEDRIRDILTLTTGATLDLPLLVENQQRVEALYRAEGFYLARVGHEVEPLDGGAVAVHFTVDEGRKLRLRAIEFEGNEHFDDDELRRGFKTKPWRFHSYVTRFLDKSGTYAEPVFQQDLDSVVKKYQDAGFIQVELEEPEVDPREDGLVVVVRLREGERYEVGALDVAGDETLDLPSLREELTLVTGEWFDRSALTADVETLADRYRDRGFFQAGVEPRTRVDPTRRIVDVTFEVAKGPLYFVREIDIAGNTTTVDPVIRREMQLVEGELYSARRLRMSESRLKGLGFFEEVTFEPKSTDRPEELDLGVKVVEKPTGSISFGAGISSQEGFIISGSLSQANLFGRGYGAQLSADLGGDTDRFYLSFSDPYFLGSAWAAGMTAFSTDIEYEDFQSENAGVDLSLGRALDEEGRTRGFVRYGYASREIDESGYGIDLDLDGDVDIEGVNAASLIQRELEQGEETTSLVGLGFRRDTRDDRVLPKRGYQLFGGVDWAGLGGFSEFARLEGRASWYTPMPEWVPDFVPFHDRSSFSLSARTGWALPFNDIGDWDLGDFASGCLNAEQCTLDQIDDDLDLPLTERYFLGGLGTYQLRGFKARSVGPRRAVLYNTAVGGSGAFFSPVGRLNGVCIDAPDELLETQGDNDGKCNSLDDTDIDDFDDLDETDVIGGNYFLALSGEYRFPISEALGLVGILFLDMGNAFSENENVADPSLWRYGTGFGALWFSPFGPLQAFVGFPLDKLEVEDALVFEFSVGGAPL